MNNRRNRLLKITAGIAAVGMVLVLAAFLMGADIQDVPLGFAGVFETGKRNLADSPVQISPDEFLGIDLEMGDGTAFVESWKEDYVEISHNGGFRRCDIRMENGIYEIEADADDGISLLGINKEKKLTIRVPENLMMHLLEISLGAGSVDVRGVTVNRLSAEVGAGVFSFKGTLDGNADLKCGAGEMALDLTGIPEDYNYQMECGIGELIVNGTSYSGIGGEYHIQNAADKSLQLECGVGRMEVSFEK